MKLLVSDYDGTLKSDIKNLLINIKYINKFMASGNKFVISTGRCFESIKKEIETYSIPYDYLTCNDGLVTFDNENKIIFSHPMDIDTIISVLSVLYSKTDVDKIKLFNERNQTENYSNILEITGYCKKATNFRICKKVIEETFPDLVLTGNSRNFYIKFKKDKSTAIDELNAILNIDSKNIYTIGDNDNDLPMLTNYNGHRILYSYPVLWTKKIPVVREVHTLIKRINRND